MKASLTNISVMQRSQPPVGSMATDGGTDAGNGKGPDITHSTLNLTGTITYAGSSPVAVAGDVTVTGMVESPFLAAFREKFVGPAGEKRWPRKSVNTPAEFSTEFTDVFRALFLRREGSVEPPQGEPNSAKQMIKELIEQTGWPDENKISLPEPWKSQGHVVTFRRYEITCAMYLLMQEYHAQTDAAGGGSTPFPPDH